MMRRAAPTLLLILACLACACQPKHPRVGEDKGQPEALWSAFLAQAVEPPASFTLSASLSLQSPQRSARLLARFWGNLDRPLRLDLSTGMGQIFAMWREDAQGWLAVYPHANQVFTHPDTRQGLSRLGMPLPFGLRDLAGLCAGRLPAMVPAKYASVKKTPKGFQYSLAQPSPIAALTLDTEGKPIHLTGRGVEPWSVELDDFAPAQPGGPPLAQRVSLTTPGGIQAVLRVKKIELGAQPMDPKTLELAVPPQARRIPLDRGGAVQAPELP
uniref:DUF4292 domain-containing protein n=1 Tax=Fundidesulfovibrio putealis TaxID=270496 RepID=A0A7C4EJD6_9BACT